MLISLCLLSCALSQSSHASTPLQSAQQVVVVKIDNWSANQGLLSTWERRNNQWHIVASNIPVSIGKSGAAWGVGLHPKQTGIQKHEGDGRSPAGVFAIADAFGYAPSAQTSLRYEAMTATHYCVDVSGSPLYNRIVDAQQVGQKAVAGSTEPMRRDLSFNGDQRYKIGFVIAHNPDGVAGAGSCIFGHLWAAPGQTTAGCTAMSEPAMRQLLAWLDARRSPRFVLLTTADYSRLRTDWDLP